MTDATASLLNRPKPHWVVEQQPQAATVETSKGGCRNLTGWLARTKPII